MTHTGFLYFLVLIGLLEVTVSAHEPRFYTAGPRNATIEVHQPWRSQAFYETLHRYQRVVYRPFEPLMHTNEDAVFFFELLLPAPHSDAQCAGVRVDIFVAGHANRTITVDGLGSDETGVFEPFTQSPLVRIGQKVELEGTFDSVDDFFIVATGPTNHSRCNVALVIGKDEILDYGTLVAFPYVSFAAWDWVYGGETWWHWMIFLFGALLFFGYQYIQMRARLDTEDDPISGARTLQLLGLSFFFSTMLLRVVAVVVAGSYGARPEATSIFFAILIVFIDLFFFVMVGAAVLGSTFSDASERVSDVSCITRWLSCVSCCCVDARENPILVYPYILLLLTAFFGAFSAGFWLGPWLVLIGLALERGGCRIPISRGSTVITNYKIWE
jgi:hypothetical protein